MDLLKRFNNITSIPRSLLKDLMARMSFLVRFLQNQFLKPKILSLSFKNLSEKQIQNLAKRSVKTPKFKQLFLGKCNICGTDTAFLHRQKDSKRESLICINCHSISRYRSIAKGILKAIQNLSGIESMSISQLPLSHNVSLRIYDTQPSFYGFRTTYALPDLLARCKWIQAESSIFDPYKAPGRRFKKNLTNQNIEKLTFPDSIFDIVITSDVMEHVRLEDQAHREIQRVLKPGGFYIFTVPSVRNRETLTRILISHPSDPNKDQFLLEKQFHNDPNSVFGESLVYRIYGTDLDTKLEALGFHVDYEWQNLPELGILETELFFCQLQNKKAIRI